MMAQRRGVCPLLWLSTSDVWRVACGVVPSYTLLYIYKIHLLYYIVGLLAYYTFINVDIFTFVNNTNDFISRFKVGKRSLTFLYKWQKWQKVPETCKVLIYRNITYFNFELSLQYFRGDTINKGV